MPDLLQQQAVNTFWVSLGQQAPGTYRLTPCGEATVADLCPPGTVIRTSYGTGPFIVLACTRHEWCDPEGRIWPHHSLSLANADRPSRSAQSWINELVAVGGRLLHLFGNNQDEVIVDGFASVAVREQLGIDGGPSAPPMPDAANDPGVAPQRPRRRVRRRAGVPSLPVIDEGSLLLHRVEVTYWSVWPGFRSWSLIEFRSRSGGSLPWSKSAYHCCFAKRADVDAAGGVMAFARSYATVAAATPLSRQIKISSARVLKHHHRVRAGVLSLFDWADALA
ncbi:hypothetical protein FZ983_27480 [Azospirillum sp. B21]|uniref:hypothetical protein n=1 Tax=Azospirillum sp. B21 TaxID=2607496 RepID=UPI0011ECA841|nr:hypothetical protein [Azospirillum sp. B21]KAA0574643.1 hypothetical protein FZ983_27480 [Azospirillum sp. B21]